MTSDRGTAGIRLDEPGPEYIRNYQAILAEPAYLIRLLAKVSSSDTRNKFTTG
jgi:hypothetical protein